MAYTERILNFFVGKKQFIPILFCFFLRNCLIFELAGVLVFRSHALKPTEQTETTHGTVTV